MKYFLLIFLILLFAFNAVAQTFDRNINNRIMWMNKEDERSGTIYVDGVEFRTMDRQLFEIAFALGYQNGYQVATVYVLNKSDSRIDVLPLNAYLVTWKKEKDYLDNKPAIVVQQIPAETIAMKMENRQRWATTMRAIGAGMQTQTATVTDNRGNSSTVTVPNTAAQVNTQNQNTQEMMRVQKTGDLLIDTALKANTIFKNQSVFGNIYFKFKKHETGIFIIKIQDYEYGFMYNYEKKKRTKSEQIN